MKKRSLSLLRRVLSLAITADNPHEAAAALGAVRTWLKAHDKDVGWLVERLGCEDAPPALLMRNADWREHIAFAAMHEGHLSDRELQFVRDMGARPDDYHASVRQRRWASSIYMRLAIVVGAYQH